MGRYVRPRTVGILGGGQLGLMLAEAGDAVSCAFRFLDRDRRAPASRRTPVTVGNVAHPVDVERFGRLCDIVTIEIEEVSASGLDRLAAAGIDVYPQPHVVARLQDKGLQKRWLADAGFPTPSFRLFADADDVRLALARDELTLPFVQKARRAGYDGRGVELVRNLADLSDLLRGPCLVEDRVDIAHELSVIVARDLAGQLAVYEPVEMCFREQGNILDLLVCPARVDRSLARRAQTLARDIAAELGIVGVLAVELFVDQRGRLLVNELAPRPHNSGHHTIETCETSQYEQHLRAITGHRLGSTRQRSAGVLVNILGKPGHHGRPRYVGLDMLKRDESTHVHLYGKERTWPLRKMGHVTIVDDDVDAALARADRIRPWLDVSAMEES